MPAHSPRRQAIQRIRSQEQPGTVTRHFTHAGSIDNLYRGVYVTLAPKPSSTSAHGNLRQRQEAVPDPPAKAGNSRSLTDGPVRSLGWAWAGLNFPVYVLLSSRPRVQVAVGALLNLLVRIAGTGRSTLGVWRRRATSVPEGGNAVAGGPSRASRPACPLSMSWLTRSAYINSKLRSLSST